jgi:hypothetical protein
MCEPCPHYHKGMAVFAHTTGGLMYAASFGHPLRLSR